MEKRILGKTGQALSVVGFGGICVMDVDAGDAEYMVGSAVESDVNYFDVAPSYGNAQERLGPALRPYRDGVFLACKTGERNKAGAQAQLHESLKLLKTDHFDLYQFHAVFTMEEVDAITGPGGALEVVLEARKKGDIRFIGFSAHSEEAAIELMSRFAFDTVMFPVNWAAWLGADFGPAVIAKAQETGVGVLALKAMAKRALGQNEKKVWKKAWYQPVESYAEAVMGMRFTLSQPVTAAVSPGHFELFKWAVEAAENFKPLDPDEIEYLREKTMQVEPVFPIKKA